MTFSISSLRAVEWCEVQHCKQWMFKPEIQLAEPRQARILKSFHGQQYFPVDVKPKPLT